MHNQSKKFLEIQAKWYAKINKPGVYEDIEQPDGNLKTWATTVGKSYSEKNVREAKEEYYRMAGQFLYDYKFASATEKFVWKHHSSGVSIRSIVGLFAKKGVKTNPKAVHGIVQRLAKLMIKGLTTND